MPAIRATHRRLQPRMRSGVAAGEGCFWEETDVGSASGPVSHHSMFIMPLCYPGNKTQSLALAPLEGRVGGDMRNAHVGPAITVKS